MLQIKNIKKEYHTGDLVQRALDDVSLELRDSEFVAILGPSGSGKTTLLNIIGGLDRYDSGDLIINSVSTNQYTDKDWDAYRNHSVGFVFQSYNLIPHQSVLENVELALTLSGVEKEERTKRAKEALERVGLKEHIYKKPSQLSGGQMQRVAIARALVNDPDILLADEPTGALDSETSVQIMDLLKDVAKDRLVVMVTHNPDLAREYATRVVRLKDGKILSDSDPIKELPEPKRIASAQPGKTKMSFLTALKLSFNNLKTKFGRTILTAFAGSIGIIGIAMILSLSNGVNTYITDIQKETMTSYPLTIEAQSLDLSSIVDEGREQRDSLNTTHALDQVYSNPTGLQVASTLTTSITENDLTTFKKYLDNPDSEIHQYLGENGIVYSYDTKFDLYSYDPEGELVNTDGSTLDQVQTQNSESGEEFNFISSQAPGSTSINPSRNFSAVTTGDTEDNNAEQILPGQDGALISPAIIDQFTLLAGSWPENLNQAVIVLDQNNEVAASKLYELGLLPSSEYNDIIKQINDGNEVSLEEKSFGYDQFVGRAYQIVLQADYYREDADGNYSDQSDNRELVDELLANAETLTISGVVRAVDEDAASLITKPIGYTQALTNHLIDLTNESAVVKAQEANPDLNILNGIAFKAENDEQKVDDAVTYLSNLDTAEKASMMSQILYASGEPAGSLSETALASMLDQFLLQPDEDTLIDLYDNVIAPGDYDENMKDFGVVSLDAPSQIDLYVDTFENKENVKTAIDHYNETVAIEDDEITYTDIVGLLMSSVTTIINVITWVLVAFVAVALIVSSIMIGIITYISVLERTKEIGILRSIGASKGNVSEVFNAETFIIGLISGLLGIGVTLLLLIPVNMVIHSLIGTTDVNATLPFWSGVVLVVLAVILTVIGGLIPAKKAANQDPVAALRSE